MMYRLALLAIPLVGSLSGLSSATSVRRDVPSRFNLYAYGDGIGGYPIFYLNGKILAPYFLSRLSTVNAQACIGTAHIGPQDQLNSSFSVASFGECQPIEPTEPLRQLYNRSWCQPSPPVPSWRTPTRQPTTLASPTPRSSCLAPMHHRHRQALPMVRHRLRMCPRAGPFTGRHYCWWTRLAGGRRSSRPNRPRRTAPSCSIGTIRLKRPSL